MWYYVTMIMALVYVPILPLAKLFVIQSLEVSGTPERDPDMGLSLDFLKSLMFLHLLSFYWLFTQEWFVELVDGE